jgi:hypothetical protein
MYYAHVPRCQHIKVNGTQCGCPALRDNRFCFFHKQFQAQRITIGAAKRRQRARFDLPVLEDANAIQVALMQVMRKLASGEMDAKIAALMLYALQTASVNLRHTRFEPIEVKDVVIDRDTVDMTRIGGRQWCKEDFEPELTAEEAAAQAAEQAAEQARLQAKRAQADAQKQAQERAETAKYAERLMRGEIPMPEEEFPEEEDPQEKEDLAREKLAREKFAANKLAAEKLAAVPERRPPAKAEAPKPQVTLEEARKQVRDVTLDFIESLVKQSAAVNQKAPKKEAPAQPEPPKQKTNGKLNAES